jgi:hypothetical protein
MTEAAMETAMVAPATKWLQLTPDPMRMATKPAAAGDGVEKPKSEAKPVTSTTKQPTKPLWSQIIAGPAPAAPASTGTATSARTDVASVPIPTANNAAVQKSSTDHTGSTPGISTSTAKSTVSKPIATAAKTAPPTTPTMTKDTALSLPTAHFLDRVTRTNNLIEEIYNSSTSLSAAAKKHGFSSAEEAGIALAIFAHQSKGLLQSRRVYKDTMLLTMAKDKDGYSGREIGELYTEAWNERKEQDREKQEQGLKRNEGQLRARQRDRQMKREGPMPGLDSAGSAGEQSKGGGRRSAV